MGGNSDMSIGTERFSHFAMENFPVGVCDRRAGRSSGETTRFPQRTGDTVVALAGCGARG